MACRVSDAAVALLATVLVSPATAAASSHDLLPAAIMLHPHVAAPVAQTPAPATLPALDAPPQRRPAALPPLYILFASLQVLDTDSTRDAIARGYGESNPVLKGVAGNDAGMILVKVGATAATIYAVEKLWRHNRVAAVVTMIAVNTAYAVVVASNYRRAQGP
jgi:hypothetical protein